MNWRWSINLAILDIYILLFMSLIRLGGVHMALWLHLAFISHYLAVVVSLYMRYFVAYILLSEFYQKRSRRFLEPDERKILEDFYAINQNPTLEEISSLARSAPMIVK